MGCLNPKCRKHFGRYANNSTHNFSTYFNYVFGLWINAHTYIHNNDFVSSLLWTERWWSLLTKPKSQYVDLVYTMQTSAAAIMDINMALFDISNEKHPCWSDVCSAWTSCRAYVRLHTLQLERTEYGFQ